MGEGIQNPLEDLKDIKPLVEIPDYSFILLVALLSLLVAILIFLIYKLYSYIKNRNAFSKKRRAIEILESLSLTNTKESAYAITKYGKYAVSGQRSENIYKELTRRVESYKYKKEVEPFEKEVIEYYNLFLEIAKSD